MKNEGARIALELKPNSRKAIHLLGKVHDRIEEGAFTIVEDGVMSNP